MTTRLSRTGLRALLDAGQDIDVVGEAGTVADTPAADSRPEAGRRHSRRPAADGSGVEVCREIRATMPEVACVMLTSYADDEALIASIMAGAAGDVLKQVGSLDPHDFVQLEQSDVVRDLAGEHHGDRIGIGGGGLSSLSSPRLRRSA